MRFITLRVLCEGQTEQNFIRSVLAPHLKTYNVFTKPESLLKGQGGIVPWDRLRHGIKADVGRSKANEYVTTMIDLYAIGNYPGVERLSGEHPYDRAYRIEQNMAQGLPNPRFLPYIQVHEFEALVFVDLSYLPAQFPDGEANNILGALQADIGEVPPEMINDSAKTAPSKRIIARLPAYAGAKAYAGPAIAEAIGVERLKEACPHFNEWVTQLERLSEE